MGSSNVESARARYQAFDRGDVAAAMSVYAENCSLTDHAQGLTAKSRDEVKEWHAQWLAFSSDGRIRVDRIVDAGNTVVCQVVFTGTNDGPLGPLPATGRRVSLEGCEVLVFDKDGKIVEDHAYSDQLSLMVQLGQAQPPGS